MGSLLDNIDNTWNDHELADPFNMLEVHYIDAHKDFLVIVDYLDLDKLREVTNQCNYDKWAFLLTGVLNGTNYLFCPLDVREKTVRLSWWLCYNLITNNKITNGSHPPKIDISQFAKFDCSDYASVFNPLFYINSTRHIIDFSKQLYNITLILPTGADLNITVENIDFIKYENNI